MCSLLLVTLPPLFFFSSLVFYQYREFSNSILYQNVLSSNAELDIAGIGLNRLSFSPWEEFDGKRHLTLRDLQQVANVVKFHSDPNPKTENESKPETESETESELFREYFDTYWNSHQNIHLFPFAQLTNLVFAFLLENYGEELGSEFIKGCELILLKMIIKSWFQVEDGGENLPTGFSNEGFEKDQEILKVGMRLMQKCTNSFESNPDPTFSSSFPGKTKQVEENTQRTITSFSLSRHPYRRHKRRQVKRRIRYLYSLKSKTKTKKKDDDRKADKKNIELYNMKNDPGKMKDEKGSQIKRKRNRKHNSNQLKIMLTDSDHVNEIMIIEQKEDEKLVHGALTRPQTRLQVKENQFLQQHEYFRQIHNDHIAEDETSSSDEGKENVHLREVDMMSFFEKNGKVESFPSTISDSNNNNNNNNNNNDRQHHPTIKDPEKEKRSENIAAIIFWFGYELFRNKCQSRLTPFENERLMHALDKTLITLISQYHYDPPGSTYKDIYLVIFQMETEKDLENSITALHKILDTIDKRNIRKPFSNTLL